MKNINPIFLLITSIFVVLISIYGHTTYKNNLEKQETKYNEFKKMALEYHDLKNTWVNLDAQRKLLEKIIKSLQLNNAKIKQEAHEITVSINTNNIKKIDSFINKLLNTQLNIKYLNVTNKSISIKVTQ
jgi:hypothetical protein